jgi:hypothetical protein
MALSSCVREGVWLWRLLIELNLIKSIEPRIISCDNQSAIKLSNNPIFHARTKHIEVHHHMLYSRTSSKWCYENHTCTLTRPNCWHFYKTVGCTLFYKFRNELGLVHINDFNSVGLSKLEYHPWRLTFWLCVGCKHYLDSLITPLTNPHKIEGRCWKHSSTWM